MSIFSLNTGLVNVASEVTYNNSEVAYSWGNTDALMKWIEAINKKQIEKSLGLSNATKYPLIWLVEGWKGKLQAGGINFSNVIFHLAVNSNVESLNENRVPGFNILYSIANDFIQKMRWYSLRIPKETIGYTERSNFSVTKGQNKESYTIDIWDTLILEMDINVNTNCIKKLCGA